MCLAYSLRELRRADRPGVIGGRRAAQLAPLRQVETPATVQDTAVIPHHEVADAPGMAVDELALRSALEQLGEQHAAFADRLADDVRRVRTDPQQLALRARVRAHQRPLDRRQG